MSVAERDVGEIVYDGSRRDTSRSWNNTNLKRRTEYREVFLELKFNTKRREKLRDSTRKPVSESRRGLC